MLRPLLLTLATAAALGADPLIVADFESETYAPWTVTGEAFGPWPAAGTLPGQMPVSGFEGRRLVNSFYKGDNSTGTLTSPPFRIERRHVAFLIGGGKNLEKLALQLVVDGRVVRSATGPNEKPGGSEELEPDSWDVSELAGRTATLRIVDEARGGWGHLNVDHIVQTDTRPQGPRRNVERSFDARTRYLHLPIKNGAPKRSVTLLIDGRPVVRNDIELADGPPDWWAPMEISPWSGRSLTLRVDRLPENSRALLQVEASDALKEADNLYREPLRGQFHFSARRGWNNDPNGCVFYNGEYHLFFQHNPYGWGWGNMHWGHAVSKDLVHWHELRPALLPDEMGPMFSGSAVVDWNNTSGFGRDGRPPLVLIYTAAGSPTVQGIAHSTDGRNFTKYSGNPVLRQITAGNRDPKVIWHEPTRKWVMVLYVTLAGGRHTVHFFTSPNLREWTQTSVTPGIEGTPYLYECPDFFELAVDRGAGGRKWVLLGADGSHGIGTFDGARFMPEEQNLRGHRGRSGAEALYAPQTFSDVPDGRRILIGWWRTETKGMPFNQSMGLPVELGLTQTGEGPRMTFTPVKELATLRARTHRLDPLTLRPGDENPLQDIRGELLEVRADFEPGEAREVVFQIRDVVVAYDRDRQELHVAGQRAAAPLRDGRQRLVLYCDRTGIEVFASDGLCHVPVPRILRPENQRLRMEARDGAARVHALEVHELRAAWKQP